MPANHPIPVRVWDAQLLDTARNVLSLRSPLRGNSPRAEDWYLPDSPEVRLALQALHDEVKKAEGRLDA